MPDIEAFEAVTISPSPSVVLYQDRQYRSDRKYLDSHGSLWSYYGLYNGASMWVREGSTTAWEITALADSVGPLTEQHRKAAAS